ncbi:hypothetical protein F8388_001021 [Cannabis sativa]|uniref:Uncharacterized protein n=1 Tax=Cannabis sativa TaxID=3483 RepID=A0A7J6DZA8_CANSA|nr:hypothetical protein F8388_001021 [Cannabis sativa]
MRDTMLGSSIVEILLSVLNYMDSNFVKVFDISSLQIFTPYELDCLLCGRREMWELLEIMGEFTPEQQWAFCQFITGAPRLPPGATKIKQSMYVVDLSLERSFDIDFTEARRPAEIDDEASSLEVLNRAERNLKSAGLIMYEMRFNIKTGLATQKQLSASAVDFSRVNESYIGRGYERFRNYLSGEKEVENEVCVHRFIEW